MSFAFPVMHPRVAKVPVPLVFKLAAFVFLVLIASVIVARATTVVAPEFPSLVNQSDYIVRAVVKSVESSFAKPGNPKIITKVELEVKEVIAGTPPSPLVLTMLGGKVGDVEMTLEGAPQFKVGDEDVLFVKGNGRLAYPLVAIMHGRYPVLKDAITERTYIARSNRVPMEDSAEVAQPMATGGAAEVQRRIKSTAHALTPELFALQIKEVAKVKSSSEVAK
ncbi:hypothetical protein [Oleiharenicola lentus]|uniref:hypothetical protein n=1 Tax=Oleiharenicola lentus TaxID=2508720 RepID=UPI003F6680C0